MPDWSKPVIALLALVALAFALRSRLATRRSRHLEGQRHALARDLEAMQRALVPVVPRQLGGLAISVAYRPAEGPAAGGDFYDVFALGRDRVAVILGDAAGHGRKALARAAQVRYSIRAYVAAGLEPREALRVAGEVLSAKRAEEDSRPRRSESSTPEPTR